MSASIGLGGEYKVLDPTTSLPRWKLRFDADADIHLMRCDADGLEVEEVLNIAAGTGIVEFAGANLNLAAGSVLTADIADAAVTPVKNGRTVRTVANDGTPAILATDDVIEIQKTANTTTAITMTTTGIHAGHRVKVVMLVGDADSVYTAAVVGGTVTFNAAAEECEFYYDGTEWRHCTMIGATFA